MRIDNYFEYGEILDGVETKILFQSKVQDLKFDDDLTVDSDAAQWLKEV